MGMRLVPLCGGTPPSRGRRGFLSSGIEVISCPQEGGGKDPEKAGPGSVGYNLFYLFKEGFSKVKISK
jgi:hypothetical protein